MTEEEKYNARVAISNELNDSGTYTFIQELAMNRFGIDIDNDSMFWNDLEEHIVNTIEELTIN